MAVCTVVHSCIPPPPVLPLAYCTPLCCAVKCMTTLSLTRCSAKSGPPLLLPITCARGLSCLLSIAPAHHSIFCNLPWQPRLAETASPVQARTGHLFAVPERSFLLVAVLFGSTKISFCRGEY